MILDISEIMLGDWVKILNNKVEWIDNCKVDLNLLFSAENCISFFEPIPLTPEILEKNGFVLKSDGWLWCAIKSIEDKNYIFIQYRKGCQEVRLCEMNFVNNVIMRSQSIQYVHELQHALKFFKIKKEIVL